MLSDMDYDQEEEDETRKTTNSEAASLCAEVDPLVPWKMFIRHLGPSAAACTSWVIILIFSYWVFAFVRLISRSRSTIDFCQLPGLC